MYTLKITEEQKNNLLIFLSRVDLKGQEALPWADLYSMINRAQMIKEEVITNNDIKKG